MTTSEEALYQQILPYQMYGLGFMLDSSSAPRSCYPCRAAGVAGLGDRGGQFVSLTASRAVSSSASGGEK